MTEQPMLTLYGKVVNVYVQPGGTNRKGEEYDPQDKVQLVGSFPVETGGHRLDIVTLSTEDGEIFRKLENRHVRVPVGVYAARSAVGFYIPRGAKPQLVQQAQ